MKRSDRYLKLNVAKKVKTAKRSPKAASSGHDASPGTDSDAINTSDAASTPREELLISAKAFVKAAGEPIWSQISRYLEELVVSGNLPSGTRLPTETQLAGSFGVNRHTLRRSLRELVRKGLITAAPRRGTIVSRRRIPFPISGQTSFREIVASSGLEPNDRLLSHRIGNAPKSTTEWLGIAERSDVVELRYVRVANDVPICLTSAWLPADRFERIGKMFDHLGCLDKALAKLGVPTYTLSQTRITSQAASQDEIQNLEIAKGAGLLVVDSLFVDDTKEPILVCHNRFAADRIELLVGE